MGCLSAAGSGHQLVDAINVLQTHLADLVGQFVLASLKGVQIVEARGPIAMLVYLGGCIVLHEASFVLLVRLLESVAEGFFEGHHGSVYEESVHVAMVEKVDQTGLELDVVAIAHLPGYVVQPHIKIKYNHILNYGFWIWVVL